MNTNKISFINDRLHKRPNSFVQNVRKEVCHRECSEGPPDSMEMSHMVRHNILHLKDNGDLLIDDLFNDSHIGVSLNTIVVE